MRRPGQANFVNAVEIVAGYLSSGSVTAEATDSRVSPFPGMQVLQFKGLELLRSVASQTFIA
ncbi:MAG: hypothetical protein ABI882_08520 [Acidobacteriota bacterium]